MADAQVPWGVNALAGAVTDPAWRTKPSWYLVASDDHTIPPPAQRSMAERVGSTVAEVRGSHAIYVSQPAAVADLIKKAARAEPGGVPASVSAAPFNLLARRRFRSPGREARRVQRV